MYPSFPAFVSADTVCCFFPAALLHMEKPQIDSEKPDVFECRPELEKEKKKKKKSTVITAIVSALQL